MKKFSLILILLLFPIYVNAQNNVEEEIVVSSITKYYKTITKTNLFNNYGINNLNDMGINSVTEEISEEEYNSSLDTNNYQRSTTVETTYKKLTSVITKTGNQYKYSATMFWKNIPKVRSYDILGIGFLSSVKIDGDITFTQKYCNSDTCTSSTTFTGKTSSTGCSAVFKLPTSEIISLEQKISFLVKKIQQLIL